ncbi:MAG: peptidase domain-containing ABC transporter [Gammaproteobacteria bacterium]|nr:peptidase domain-containing ABC transporter [Gammaproteobacteria bacterium]MBU1414244.1 peptidase domain-containing ABC transporter [Gammaproteobacteria bacterium]
MIAEPVDIDIGWLAQRCAALHASLHRPSRREIRSLQDSIAPDALAADADGARTERLRETVATLFRSIGLDAPEWRSAPTQDALPMVALIPGIGCRVIYARTPEGHWLMECPNGSQQLFQVPLGGQYAAMSARAAGNERTTTALAMFRNALFARKGVFVQAALASLLANVLAISASIYSMQVYDRVIPTQGVSTLIVLTIGVMLAAVLELVVKMARSAILENSIKGMDLELSHKIFLRLLGLRMDQFPASVGTLSSQLRSYETIRGFASAATLYVAVDAPFALLFVGVIWLLGGAPVAAVPAVFFLLALTVGLFYRSRIARHAESGNVATNRKLGLLVETVESAEAVKATGAGWQQLTRWDTLNRQSVEDDIKIRRYSEQASYFAAFMQQSSYILLVATGAWIAATTTDLTMGGLIACSILSGRVLGPVGALPGLIVQWAHARAALDSLEKVFALQCDNHDIVRPLTPEHVRGEFQVADLRFAYPGRPETLSIERLHIRAGEKVAILGAVGAGKSTLLKLLAGLYMPNEGRVLLDGLDIQQIARAHLSEHIGYSPQDVKLLAGSLRENLTAGLTGVDEADMLRACEATGLGALVASHPKGLDLDIAEGGTGVSGGQKQLVALTRMLLAKPDVWLLDEPTAAMDEQTELRSLQALRQAVSPQQTVVIVTHKPSLIALADRLIILMPGGRVFMDGPRDAVLEKLRQQAQNIQKAQGLRAVKPDAGSPAAAEGAGGRTVQ